MKIISLSYCCAYEERTFTIEHNKQFHTYYCNLQEYVDIQELWQSEMNRLSDTILEKLGIKPMEQFTNENYERIKKFINDTKYSSHMIVIPEWFQKLVDEGIPWVRQCRNGSGILVSEIGKKYYETVPLNN